MKQLYRALTQDCETMSAKSTLYECPLQLRTKNLERVGMQRTMRCYVYIGYIDAPTVLRSKKEQHSITLVLNNIFQLQVVEQCGDEFYCLVKR